MTSEEGPEFWNIDTFNVAQLHERFDLVCNRLTYLQHQLLPEKRHIGRTYSQSVAARVLNIYDNLLAYWLRATRIASRAALFQLNFNNELTRRHSVKNDLTLCFTYLNQNPFNRRELSRPNPATPSRLLFQDDSTHKHTPTHRPSRDREPASGAATGRVLFDSPTEDTSSSASEMTDPQGNQNPHHPGPPNPGGSGSPGDANPGAANNQVNPNNNAHISGQNYGIPKPMKELRPPKLLHDATLEEYDVWCTMYHSYFFASNLQNCPPSDHLAFLYANVDSRLASHLAVNATQEVGMYEEDEQSLFNILASFFESLHPVYARRAAIFGTRRESGQSYSEYFKKIIKLCKEARTDQISTETLVATFLANTVSHEALRHELLTEEDISFEFCVEAATAFENTTKGRPNMQIPQTNVIQGKPNKQSQKPFSQYSQQPFSQYSQQRPFFQYSQQNMSRGTPPNRFCTYCKIQGHTYQSCRTRNNICNKCKQKGHIPSRCPSTQYSSQRSGQPPFRNNIAQISGPEPHMPHPGHALDAYRPINDRQLTYNTQGPYDSTQSAQARNQTHFSQQNQINAINSPDDPYMFCPKVQL